jgi:hypothetical protein
MAFTQADLDAIESAIAKGEAVVVFADRRVEYRSMADLEQARKTIISALAAAAGRSKQTLVVANKGLTTKVCP